MKLTDTMIDSMNSELIISIVNTNLRDFYSNLNDLVDDWDISIDSLKHKLSDYEYDESQNQFKLK